MRYHFRISPPADGVKLRILESDREGPLLAATFSGRRRALTTSELLRAFVALPLVTLKIVAAIHWEALRLWLKGVRLVARETTATANAADMSLASGESRAYSSSSADARLKRALRSSEGPRSWIPSHGRLDRVAALMDVLCRI